MMVYELENITKRNIKSDDYRCFLWNIVKIYVINRLNHSKLHDKDIL